MASGISQLIFQKLTPPSIVLVQKSPKHCRLQKVYDAVVKPNVGAETQAKIEKGFGYANKGVSTVKRVDANIDKAQRIFTA